MVSWLSASSYNFPVTNNTWQDEDFSAKPENMEL